MLCIYIVCPSFVIILPVDYKDLSSELKGYLKKFAENGQVVKRRDIEEFFEEMTERKKRKIEEEGQGIPPDSCHF